MGKYFGTDGVRGIANIDLTLDLVLKIGKALAFILNENATVKPTVVIGKDTRQSSDMIEAGLISTLLAYGVDVVKIGVVPTPCVALMVKHYSCSAGIMISASHNAFEYNGIKIFNKNGFKLDDDIEERIETLIDNEQKLSFKTYENIGKVFEKYNAIDFYSDYILDIVDTKIDNIKVAIDCANGSSYSTCQKIFGSLCDDLEVIHCTPNGKNINYNCGSTHMETLKTFVVNNKCDIGIAFDGDADRCLCVDENGNIIDGDMILCILAKYFKDNGKLKNNTCVSTVMSNIGFFKFLNEHGIKNVKTKVGDRFVLEEMLKGDYILGGEQSGHIILKEYMTTGDGQLSASMFLKVLKESGQKASELKNIMVSYPQVLVNVKVDNETKCNWKNNNKINNVIDKYQNEMQNNGRILVRESGTEPLIRVMIEGKDIEKIKEIAKEIAYVIERG